MKRKDITEEEAQEMLRTKDFHVFVDNDFARWCSDHNCDWNDSNFFMSDNPGTLSNCCFSGDIMIKLEDGEVVNILSFKDAYQKYANKQIKVYDRGEYRLATLLRLPSRMMYKLQCDKGGTIVCTDNHIFPTINSRDVEAKNLNVGDKLQYFSEEPDGTNSVSVANIISISRTIYEDKYVYCVQMEDNDNPYFTLANGIITHNCRLLSDTKKLDAFINSIGGTALSIGSEKVNTINLMRIALESEGDQRKYLKILRERAILCCKALDVVRHIISRNIQKKLLPNYVEGGVEMEKQYSTIGIIGLYEVIEEFGLTEVDEFGNVSYTDGGIEFASEIFEVLNDVKDNFNSMKKKWIKVNLEEDQYKDLAIEYSLNCESVPGERCAVILCQKDNELYERNDKFIYSNQWIPLSAKCTINEKLRVSSILDAKCSGGAISHVNLESNFPDKDAAWEMLNKIALTGVIYFAFNTRINECKNHHGFVGSDHCPICGEPIFDTYVRIVGYLVPVRNFSKDRFREFNSRKWFNYASELKDF